MLKISGMAALCAAAIIGLTWAAPAQAQATRTWVSGVGNDADPCSRTAPCKTFAGAISKTAAGGEIDCLDGGGFGALTISKSISIDCSQGSGEGGVLASGTNGFIVNAGVNDRIMVAGIQFEGFGTGINGIDFLAGKSLIVTHCIIRAFTAGAGVLFVPTGGGTKTLSISDTIIANNGTASTGGVVLKPGAATSVLASLERVQLINNTNGLKTDTTTASAGTAVAVISNSVISGGAITVAAVANGVSTSAMAVNRSVVQGSATAGLFASGSKAAITLGGSVLNGHVLGISTAGGGAVVSFGNSELSGNTANGTFTTTIALQ